MLGRPGAQAALAEPARGRGQAGRPAEPGDGHQRPGLLGEVRQLLGRRDAARADGGRPLHLSAEEAVEALRREHDRRRRASSARPSTAATSRSRRSARRSTRCRSETGLDIPVHVDGASGAMIAPFLDPDLDWDFRLPRVRLDQHLRATSTAWSIPGVGWVVWRDADALPEDLIFNVNYLGGDMPTFALNFSRPGSQVVAQYYNFLRLGFDGYRRVQQATRATSRRASPTRIAELGAVPAAHPRRRAAGVRVHARTTTSTTTPSSTSRGALRERGWLVPGLHVPGEPTDLAVLRVVVRQRLHPRPGRPAPRRPAATAPRLQSQPEPVHDASTLPSPTDTCIG